MKIEKPIAEQSEDIERDKAFKQFLSDYYEKFPEEILKFETVWKCACDWQRARLMEKRG